MDKLLLFGILAGLGVVVVILTLSTWRAAKTRSARRGAYLDQCRALFSDVKIGVGATGFARLSGRYQTHLFDIQVVPDTLTFRKLPALWVLVTLPEPLPLRATSDLMIRPTGVEPFSNFRTLPDQIALPAGFPEDCALRTDAPEHLPDQALLRRHLGNFDNPRLKEMILSPKGARLVFLAEEAERSRYLIYRDCEMGQVPMRPERLKPQLDALITLRMDVLQTLTPKGRRLSA